MLISGSPISAVPISASPAVVVAASTTFIFIQDAPVFMWRTYFVCSYQLR